ncbi:MAG TPA: dihydropteroate synthase [Terriglobales bacterium]|nr:dihydropteroate synthase [Terriglobales bacterium]
MRPSFTWKLRTRSLQLGHRTLVMGVLNVTPDSFSDGARFFECGPAVEHALSMLDDGADILDLGGESTRPGSRAIETAAEQYTGVPVEEELRRVMPVLEGIHSRRPDALLSIDTYKAEVARRAVAAGAEIVNDISALRWDPQMPAAVAELACGVILMHMRGRPQEWRALPPLTDAVGLVARELRQWSQAAMDAGVARDRIVLDPGFGFGKSFEENYPLLAHFEQLHRLGFPLLAGTSRKSFIGRTLARNGHDAPPDARLHGSLASTVACILKGAHIVRVHDVKPAVEAAKIADAVLAAARLSS